MKTKITMTLLAACGALALSAGCSKNEAAAQAPADRSAVPSQSVEAERATPAAQATETEKLAQTAAAAQEQGRIQSLIDTAKTLTGQNKYAEALKILGNLANAKLTPEQQTQVDGLKQTAEKQAAQAMADKAATSASTAVGDVLGGNK